jgi:hypothetical protein
MAESTDAQMVTLLKAALAASPIGVVSVTVDGETIQYSRKQALDELHFWEARAAVTAGTRPRSKRIDLSGF